MRKYNIAVLGATGLVGRNILKILYNRKFPVGNIFAIASDKSKNKMIKYSDNKLIRVDGINDINFNNVDIIFSSIGSKLISKYVNNILNNNNILIDNSSYFRMQPDVPLIIPEVNPDHIDNLKKSNIIANPNCSTIQMLIVLKPIHEYFDIKKLIVSTYQSVSGAGQNALNELDRQLNNNINDFNKNIFPKRIAENIIPQIDVFLKNGDTKEEQKICLETNKILDKNIKIHANCARVPSINCHAEFVNVETYKTIDYKKLYKILENFSGIKVLGSYKNNCEYITPIEANNTDDVFVSRIRKDYTVKNGISFWCVADNIRKGAALNAVQIAELIIKKKLL